MRRSGTGVRSVASLQSPVLFQPRLDQIHEIDRALRHAHAGGLEGLELFCGRSRRTRDDRAGVAHAAARWSGLAGDEPDDGLLHVLLDERSRLLLIGPADFAHHRDGLRVRILLERREAVDEVGAVDRIAADADTARLPDSGARELIDDLIRERTRPAHDAHRAL